MNTDAVLKPEEKTAFALRALYRSFGYRPYRMSKFEAYDLYAKNKDFLISENVITFTDTDGKLLALKPDVTLSIIKNGEDGTEQKVYYNENVYRVAPSTGSYKEIMQVGLEYIGNVDDYGILEVLHLAYESLAAVSDRFVLNLSHLGVVSELIENTGVSAEAAKAAFRYIGEKNRHDMEALLRSEGASEDSVRALSALFAASGPVREVLPLIEALSVPSAAHLLKIARALSSLPNVRIDFSVSGDMKYYNGIVFQGFVSGIPAAVLSGGQYDNLMQKMHRTDSAIGFAVYLDLMSYLAERGQAYDVDALLLYGEDAEESAVYQAVRTLQKEHKSVLAHTRPPAGITWRSAFRLTREGVIENE